jgi:hypothetical protein
LSQPIDALVEQLAQRMDDCRDWYSGAVRTTERELERAYQRTARELHKTLFAPIEQKLGDIRKVYLSPDGQLHNLPFEALVADDGRYLIEQGYQFAYLASGRDLLRENDRLGKGTYVFAAPDYDLPHAERHRHAQAMLKDKAKPESDSPEIEVLAMSDRPRGTRSADLRGSTWKPLVGADQEGVEAVKQFQGSPFGPARLYRGADALEEAFHALSRPRVLVVVTHGFFLQDQDRPDLGDERWLLGGFDPEPTRSAFGAGVGLSRLRGSENPLLRSGLVLAGANRLDDPLPEGFDVEDGWLSAEEISQLDLRGTELVVLSACSSSRGQVATGEAVAGLRSALLFAGAQTIVGSLYAVPDEETRELMHDFYTGIRAGGGKLESLNTAQQAMIARRRAKNAAAHPFFWASFILVGEP